MKIARLLFITFSLLLTAVPARATLIDYDNTGNQLTEILNYYAGLPASPDHSSGFMWLDFSGSTNSIYGPHSLTAVAFSLEVNPVSVSWSEDVKNVNFWYGYADSENLALSVQGYNDGGLVFDSGSLPLNSNGMFQYTAPNFDIDQLVFNGTPSYWTVDDLSYDLAGAVGVVPEPMSALLFGSGLLGLTRMRRNRRRSI